MLESYTESERRRAEDRILRDMDRIDMPQAEPEGGFWGTLAVLAIVAFLLFVCLAVPGCGTVAGFGQDLQAVSEGVRAEMAKD